jgi:hypothetical protein
LKLNERLNEFIGHEIAIITRNDIGETRIPAVLLEEIGEDYLTVMTEYNENTQYSPPNERKFISLLNLVQIVHKNGCNKCVK